MERESASSALRDGSEPASEPDRFTLSPTPSSIGLARRTVDSLLAHTDPTEDFRFRFQLAVSELMTNAVMHSSPVEPVRVVLAMADDHGMVKIHNRGTPIRTRKLRRGRPGGGRGLDIVDAISDRWIIDSGPAGTTITAWISRF
jgi:anti-sigma regulatory factor (Ser/Thr protein kinase)